MWCSEENGPLLYMWYDDLFDYNLLRLLTRSATEIHIAGEGIGSIGFPKKTDTVVISVGELPAWGNPRTPTAAGLPEGVINLIACDFTKWHVRNRKCTLKQLEILLKVYRKILDSLIQHLQQDGAWP